MRVPKRPVMWFGLNASVLGATMLAVIALGSMGCGAKSKNSAASDPGVAAQSHQSSSLPEPGEHDSPGEHSASAEITLTPTAIADTSDSDTSDSVAEVSNTEVSHTEASDTVPSHLGEPDDPEQAQTGGPFRLLLPTTVGPLLVDLDIRVGDQALSDVFARRIESVLEQAGDGDELTWNRLLQHIEANPAAFGRAQVDSQQYRNMIRMYDKNRNMRPEPDELAHFLFRDSGSSGCFRMVGSNFYRQINRTESPMFLAMDSNGNQVLEAEELGQAWQSLARLDRNGDQRIDIAEVMPPSSGNNANNIAWNNRNTSRWGDVAMDLGGFVDWSMVSYALDEAPRQGVFHEGPNAIAGLDQNGDETIDRDEARRLLEVPADIRLRVHFASSLSSEPRIEVDMPQRNPQVMVTNSPNGDRIRIGSDRFQLIATVRDLRAGGDAIPLEAFNALDADKNGGLDQTEIPSGALREYSFDDLDQDNDGKLTHRELVEGLNPISPIWTVQVRARGAEAPDAIYSWLDQDQNGLLSTRELLACRERLQGLTSTQTGLRAVDLPDTFLIQFGRGDPQQDEALFASMPVRPELDAAWPRWAESMDSNQDGDLSADEFLGQIEQFEQLDRNGDGFLSRSEIE